MKWRMQKALLLDLYDLLYGHYGPQHWWPAKTPFEVMVGAILTQGVAWRNVEVAIARLEAAHLLTPRAVYAAAEDELAEHIRSTLYYRAKARKLKSMAGLLVEQWEGELSHFFARPTAVVRRDLLGVWGIGPETADAMLLYAGGHPVFVVDLYTRRIFSRLGWITGRESYGELQEAVQSALGADVQLYNEYHALLDRLAKDTCRARRPLCSRCPVALSSTLACPAIPVDSRSPTRPHPAR